MLAGSVAERKSLPRWFVAVFPSVGCLSRHLFLCLQPDHAGFTIEVTTFVSGSCILGANMAAAESARSNDRSCQSSRFATTHWSVVRAAGRPESSRCQAALETLCRAYWFPIYSYLRRRGYRRDRAEDYTQGFFARLLEKDGLRLADPARGKFRSFLLVALRHFLANEADRNRAQKRGGGRHALSIDFADAEDRYAIQPAEESCPESAFERSWALAILDRAMSRLQAELVDKNRGNWFEPLKAYLTAGRARTPYRQVAAELSMSENAVKVAVHRLRKRYRELLRDEIAQTVTSEAEIDEEIRDLFAALAR